MKTLRILSLLILPLLVLAGCGDDDDTDPPTPPSDQEVLAAGWDAYEQDDLADAEAQFRELLGRGALLANAHNGLGWVFAAQSAADSAQAHFVDAVTANGGDDGALDEQAYAGQAFALDALGEWEGVLDAAAEVPEGWTFPHDPTIDRNDIHVLQAVAHYALGEFGSSLVQVQIFDAAFEPDLTTAAGLAELAARIEALLISV